MDRRAFLTTSVAGGVATMAGGRRRAEALPHGSSRAKALPHGTAPPHGELDELTVADLQRRMASGQETARSIAEKSLARIAALDRDGPALRAVLDTNPEALQIAESLDAERKAGRIRGPLHGIPVLLKDNVGTADRMTTTAGSLALEGSIPAKDSFVAKKLREAGAVLLGKTNMSEWANFRSTRSTSGWSGRGGRVRNPYVLDRNTSGSSSGSGAAIAANYAAVAIGSETDGSIVSPSNNCGLVGIKPSLGLVSRSGVIPIAHSQDTAGPMARTVADAAALLTAIVGFDADDAVTKAAGVKMVRDYTKALDAAGAKGMRIGVPRKALFGSNPHADRLVDEAIAVLKSLGAEIVDPVNLSIAKSLGDHEYQVLLYEFKADLNAYFASLGPNAPVKSLRDAIEFNERHKDREMPYFGQEIFLDAEKKGPLTTPEYKKALAASKTAAGQLGIDRVMAAHRLDALVAPTSGPAGLADLVNGDYGSGGCSTLPAVSGYPHITVPAGFAFGLPVGVSFFGKNFSEMTLIRIAYAYEQATKHRKAPTFLATAEI
jgi:amidase